jgi:hypothetical protein
MATIPRRKTLAAVGGVSVGPECIDFDAVYDTTDTADIPSTVQ